MFLRVHILWLFDCWDRVNVPHIHNISTWRNIHIFYFNCVFSCIRLTPCRRLWMGHMWDALIRFKQLSRNRKTILFILDNLPDMYKFLRLAGWLLELPVERYSDLSNSYLHTSGTIVSYWKEIGKEYKSINDWMIFWQPDRQCSLRIVGMYLYILKCRW